jgi:hypothetical protein
MSLPSTDFSFDPRDPWFEIPGWDLSFAVQIFSTDNGYVVDPERAEVTTTDGELLLTVRGLARAGRQQLAPGALRVNVTLAEQQLTFALEAVHPEGVKAVKLLLRGFPRTALSDGWWTATSGRDEPNTGRDGGRFQWTYPSQEWMTPWACVGASPEAFTIGVRDPDVRIKRLHVSQPPYAEEPIVEIVHQQRAGARAELCVAPEIRVGKATTEAAIATDFELHLAAVESSYGLTAWSERADVPDWLEQIELVVTLHGQHWTGYVFNTFAEMEEALRLVAREIEGRHVLAYLPGWEGRYYHVYPRYEPGPDLGGADGFQALIETAHELGVHVMPMFGAHGANISMYPDWQTAAIRNDTDRYLALLNAPDWDGDRAGEGDQIFLNPGEVGFGDHLAAEIVALVSRYGVDAVFLDTAAFWFDDPRYDQLLGYQRLLTNVRARNPALVVACEGWFDAMLGMFPLVQQWLGIERDFRYPELLTRYARTTGHLAEGAPGTGSTGVHEEGFRRRNPERRIAGHIPSISVVDDTLSKHADELAAFCRAVAAAHDE